MKAEQTEEIFSIYSAKNQYKGLLSIPHSGEIIPDEFKEYLIDDFDILSRDVDTGVHELIDINALNEAGITVIKAHIHRICIDLNRPLDNSMLNWKKNSRAEQTVVKEPNEETRKRLQIKYHSPYYEMLKALINELKKHSKKASFVDLHSMPSRATDYHLKINPNQKVIRPPFCLSDVNGASCDENFIKTFHSNFQNLYPSSSVNDPYFGGNVTREINSLFPDINNIQIEISRKLYLNEDNRTMIQEKVADLKPKLTDMLIRSFDEVFEGN